MAATNISTRYGDQGARTGAREEGHGPGLVERSDLADRERPPAARLSGGGGVAFDRLAAGIAGGEEEKGDEAAHR